jgi:hypothetical protein
MIVRWVWKTFLNVSYFLCTSLVTMSFCAIEPVEQRCTWLRECWFLLSLSFCWAPCTPFLCHLIYPSYRWACMKVYSCIMMRMLLSSWCNFEILCLTSCSQKNGRWARRLPSYVFIISILALYLAASKNQILFLWKIQCKWLNPMVTWQHHLVISQIDKCILHE